MVDKIKMTTYTSNNVNLEGCLKDVVLDIQFIRSGSVILGDVLQPQPIKVIKQLAIRKA